MGGHGIPGRAGLHRRPLFLAFLALCSVAGLSVMASMRAPTAVDASTVLEPPTSIDTSGDTDVSDALSSWIATSVPDGTAEAPTIVRLAGTFRVEYGIDIGSPGTDIAHPGLPASEKRHVEFDLTHAVLQQRDPTPFSNVNGVIVEPRKRWGVPIIKVVGGEDIRIVGGTLVSTNGNGVYSAQREPWHGVTVVGTQGLRLVGLHIEGVWGDFVYLNHRGSVQSADVLIDGGTYVRNGRQGVTLNAVRGLEVRGVEFRNVQRMLFDHEPDLRGGATAVSIHDNTGGSGGLGYVNLRPLVRTPLGGISIVRNRIDSGHFKVFAGAGGVTRAGFEFSGNATAATDAFTGGYLHRTALITVGGEGAGWSHVVVQGNHDHGLAQVPALAISAGSTDVVTTPNDFVGFRAG
jgi:hypothetical protein